MIPRLGAVLGVACATAFILGLILAWKASSAPYLIEEKRLAEVRLETCQAELYICLDQISIVSSLSEACMEVTADAIYTAELAVRQQVVLLEMLGLDAISH